MKNAITRIGVAFIVILSHQVALAKEPNAAVDLFLDELKESATAEDFQQIADAIRASDSLQHELTELAAAKRFSGFVVSPRDQVKDGRVAIFGGFTQGTKIVFTTEFLKELKESPAYDVVYPDDIAPDNTVFALTHLLHHIRTPLDPRGFSTPAPFVEAAVKIEAAAFIRAWNATLQVAEQSNGGKPLSQRQWTQLLMNSRYRFALIRAMNQKVDPLTFSPTGFVDVEERNIQAVAVTLKSASHADLE